MKTLILLILPLFLIGCCTVDPLFLKASKEHHDYTSGLIKDYIIDRTPIPDSLLEDGGAEEIQTRLDEYTKSLKKAEEK